MKRLKTYSKIDKRIFTQTAGRTRRINISTPITYRGGIRL